MACTNGCDGGNGCGCGGCGTPAGCCCTSPASAVDTGCGTRNPCCAQDCNTVQCESLASQIANFTQQFFGVVVKSEVDGQVVWTLPCDLAEGLPNNPRAADEGLACYFKRLFMEGIIGLTGPVGPAGTAGTNGFNAYTVTLASFFQPSSGSPSVQVNAAANPAILSGLYVFIANSGWYFVNFVDPSGILYLTLAQSVSGVSPGDIITAGKLVVPAGFPGTSVQGPQGIQGPAGPQGTPGTAQTTTNGGYFDSIGTNYTITNVSSAVDYSSTMAQVLLPDAGTYVLMATVGLEGQAGVVATDVVELKLRDVTASADLPGSLQTKTNFTSTRKESLALIPIPYVSTGPNHTVRLYAKFTTTGGVKAIAARTSITFVRVA